ncbi:response regulator transcription factor [Gilvimarinus sp. 1_MG-2023]|uniref:response regulator transcription factor n=1 Tax=Gilvimarinus sp. 1_MG-2023 TaxID=3062638 RepID=UPI0026E2642A|nr:response regulator transcription factor [Gilvimarinus sp. 1_MG-2023]MDO6748461.1 response regulator transcription factor [Gilvimarinus sp. 1_MG-2023]
MSNRIHLAHVNHALPKHRKKRRFLVVEDEQDLAELIRLHLKELDAEVEICGRGDEALTLIAGQTWDVVVLDLMLPGVDGLDICRSIRADGNNVPVLMLTSRSTELDRVLGLELGADDYLTKPFSTLELMARVKALLRRSELVVDDGAGQYLEIRNLTLDKISREVSIGGKALDLTAKEFDLLWYFAENPGRVFRRTELLDHVWGYGHEGYEHTVNSHINRLRSKLEKVDPDYVFIKTVWGVGYKFCSADELDNLS